MSWPSLRYELRKALVNPWFMVALVAAAALAVASAVEAYLAYLNNNAELLSYGYELGLGAHVYYGQTPDSCFGTWIVTNSGATLCADLFFYALPLLAVIPFAWSWRSEMRNGYAAQACTRMTRGEYVRFKAAAVFVSGALVAAVPLIVNFTVVSCLFPSYLPLIEEYQYVGVADVNFFSLLFYTMPYLYVVVWTLFDAFVMGLWATVVMGLSVVFSDRVKLMVVPYLLMFAWHYFNGWILDVLGIVGFGFNLQDATHSYSALAYPNFTATLVELAVLAVFVLLALRTLSKREVL